MHFPIAARYRYAFPYRRYVVIQLACVVAVAVLEACGLYGAVGQLGICIRVCGVCCV